MDPNERLFLAAVNGDLAALASALAAGADPDKGEELSCATPLGWAVRMGHADCARALMAAGADPWASESFSSTSAVGCAMTFERWDLMGEILASPKGCNPAALKGAWGVALRRAQVAALPSFARADVALDDFVVDESEAWSPVAWAIGKERPEMLRVLLSLGANPEAPVCEPKANGGSFVDFRPIDLAVEQGQAECLSLLLEAGATIDGPRAPGSLAARAFKQGAAPGRAVPILAALQGAGADLGRPGVGGELMELAASRSDADVARWLLALGVDPSRPRFLDAARCPLDLARLNPSRPDIVELMEAAALSIRERSELSGEAPAALASPSPKRRM